MIPFRLEKLSKIILGIDPGTLMMGYCIIEVNGHQIRMIDMGVLKMSERTDHYLRLQQIHQKVTELIASHQPKYFAIEAPFFGNNVQSMLKLGRAQGVAIAAAMHAGMEVSEYSPRKIKQSITGNGNSAKEQVWKMLQQILNLQDMVIKHHDASDALAVAVCHHFQANALKTTKGSGARGWKEYLSLNPDRLRLK
jgi:crossover junction endodeoxyribonuclease RuvC